MADPDQLAMLSKGIATWNQWRRQKPEVIPDLQNAQLPGADLRSANFSGANLSRANLRKAELSDANLNRANLEKTALDKANLRHSQLLGANLASAALSEASLTQIRASGAVFVHARLNRTVLVHADLSSADLSGVNLDHANLKEINLRSANLTGAILRSADFTAANLTGANLTDADMGSAKLQFASLDEATLTGARLWETQRIGWSIKDIVCERIFWSNRATEPTIYAPGEFERLYSEQTCIELFYEGGVSTFELNTLPALLYHLASLHSDTNIRLKSIEETGGGARISISVGDADAEAAEKIKADAMQVYRAQLALREKESERLQIEKSYLESLFLGRLIPAMLSAGTPQNVFNAPVTGLVLASGDAKVDFRQTVNDNSALVALLERMIDRSADLSLSAAENSRFENEIESAKDELQKPNPDKSVLAKSVLFVQKLATEALTRAAGKLGEAAISADWQMWLHQLGHFAAHLG